MTAFNHSYLQANLLAPVTLTHADNSRKAMVFALQLMRHDNELTLSEALWYAWDELKKFGEQYRLIKFRKTNGEEAQRIVMAGPASQYVPVKGTGRPLKPGQQWFCDAARLHCGKRSPVVSTYCVIKKF